MNTMSNISIFPLTLLSEGRLQKKKYVEFSGAGGDMGTTLSGIFHIFSYSLKLK